MDYVAGVDQGGTKTLAVVADAAGIVRGIGQAPGATPWNGGIAGQAAMVGQAVRAAMAVAGAPTLASLHGGLTCIDWPEEAAALDAAVAALRLAQLSAVENDAAIALRAACDGAGAVIVGGTGANAAIRGRDGTVSVYGHYWPSAAQGSSALGRAAVEAVVAAAVGAGSATALSDALLPRYGSCDGLLRRHTVPGDITYSSLAPLVTTAAANGDPVAQELIARFSATAARWLVAGLRRRGLAGCAAPVAFGGSLLGDPCMRAALSAALRAEDPTLDPRPLPGPPVIGAVLAALQAIGGDASAMRRRLAEQATAMLVQHRAA